MLDGDGLSDDEADAERDTALVVLAEEMLVVDVETLCV